MPPTATLAQYIGADTVRKVEGENNTYELDGTKYIVPDEVLTAAESLQSGENIRGRNVSTDPAPSDLGASEELLNPVPPETLYVTGTGGWTTSGVEWRVGKREDAESVAETLRNAEQIAAEHYPEYWEEKLGADYSVKVTGPGLCREEMFGDVDVPEHSDGGDTFVGLFFSAYPVETIYVSTKFDQVDHSGITVGDGYLVFYESATNLPDPRGLAEDVAAAYREAGATVEIVDGDPREDWW